MTELLPVDPAFALLTDGTQVQIRPLRPDDEEAVRTLHRALSPESLYLRFFTMSRSPADEVATRLCRLPCPGHAAVGAWLGRQLVGVAGYEPTADDGAAEVALAVADHMQHRGVGTLLLEHLGSLARSRGVRRFRADVLSQNTAMLRVFADAGLPVGHAVSNGGVVEVHLPLDVSEHYLDAVAGRESRATVESLRPLLRPGCVAVVGAGRRLGSVGNAVLRHVRDGGFAGSLYAVNPRAGAELDRVACVASVEALPEPPDLAVITVPARAVATVAEECGRRGARSLLVITSGLTERDGRGLLAACHRYGMRLVGPNCLGIAVPGSGLDTTFAPVRPTAGSAGVMVQSGGVGIALLEHLSRLGIGISSFASVGDKYDVSANDLLQWWERDDTTRLGVLHLESFGNPRKFARTARRVARRMPLLTVLTGRSQAGQRAAASHTAAVATPDVTRRALFTQAGIIATDDLGELVEAAALLAHQPFPQGPRTAIVSNAGGAGVLAADACAEAGLTVPDLSDHTQRALRDLLPECAAVGNPVDTTAAISAQAFGKALELVAADDGVDSLLVVVVPTALGDLPVEPHGLGKPVAVANLGQDTTVTVDADGVPSYAFPEDAARALGHAWRYARWRARPSGIEPVFTDLRPDRAQAIIDRFLDGNPDGGWLPPAQAMELLESYRLPMAPWQWAVSEDAAVYAAQELGGHVALKAHADGVIHKTEAGALRLDLRGDDAVRHAYRDLAAHFGDALDGVLVQAMAGDGVEVLCGVVQEQIFGPLIVFGLGGVATEVLGDRSARLAPLTETDADDLIGELRAAPLLRGHRGSPAADLPALRDTLLRLSRLAADHPQIAELDINPLIAGPLGVTAVDARIRLVPQRPWDPFLRRLR